MVALGRISHGIKVLVVVLLCPALLISGCARRRGLEIVALPSPTSTIRAEEVPGNRVRVWPSSAPVEAEVPYRFELYTRCGVGNAIVDFDESLWSIPPPGLRPSTVIGLEEPADPGQMMLLDENTARFVTSEGAFIEFLRVEDSRIYPRCALEGV